MLVLQTLPGAFLHIAQCLKEQKLRSDFRHRLLSLYSDVGLVAEAKNGRFRIISYHCLLTQIILLSKAEEMIQFLSSDADML